MARIIVTGGGGSGATGPAGATGVTGATGAAGGAGINDVRWTRLAADGAASAEDDEFRDASINAKWARVDNAGHTGYVTWAEGGDSLGVITGVTQDAAAELHAYMQPLVLAVGDSISAHISAAGFASEFPMAGLIVANGNTYGAGLQIVMMFSDCSPSAAGVTLSQWSNYSTRDVAGDIAAPADTRGCHFKIKRGAANVWSFYTSADGVQWALQGTSTLALTPSHVGICATGWGTTTPHSFAFDYFRRQTG